MVKYLKHIKTVIIHKYFVFVAGRKLGVGIGQLLVHDLSKFSWVEIKGYSNRDNKELFEAAWQHHIKCNPHHWEYWNDPEPNMIISRNEMPDKYIRELVADWLGSCRAYEGFWPEWGNYPWLEKNWNKMNLHPKTREAAEQYLVEYLTSN